jgi:hypothetical protein
MSLKRKLLKQLHLCENNPMSKCKSYHKVPWSLLVGFLVLAPLANTQESKPLVQIQRLRTEMETDSNAMSNGRNSYSSGLNGSQQMDVRQYPNSATCLVVYDDGKYFFEKREEHTMGKPKAKLASGVLSADDLQHLKAILDDEGLKKITNVKAPELPSDAQVLKEAESLDVQVSRGAESQQFTFMKERLKTGPPTMTGAETGSMSGLDAFLDNGEPYKKTVAPLLKWFDEVGKKNKLKESKPQYCQ